MPQVLAGIYVGQVTILVSFGLVAFMATGKKGSMVLGRRNLNSHIHQTTPCCSTSDLFINHHDTKTKIYEGWLGIFTAGIVCLIVLFTLRPQLITDLVWVIKNRSYKMVYPNNWRLA